MLSASKNTLHPAFSWRQPDRTITFNDASIPEERQLSREQLHVWSYQEPPLTVGEYTLSVSQHLEVFDPKIEQTVTKDLLSPTTQLRVSSPKFELTDPQVDIHSVYPAPGHSDHAKTLAHVVFRRSTAPWERRLVDGSGKWDNGGMTHNRMPWLGVLSFTEDELVLDEKTCRDAGFEDTTSRPSSQGTIKTTAGRLESLTGVVSPLSGNAGLPSDQKKYADKDGVNILLIARSLFQSLFANYNETGQQHQQQSPFIPDLSRFSRMAHVRETHAGFMASTVELMDNSGTGPNPQPQFSVVISPRTGPPGEEKPRRVISHLISLEDIYKMTASLQPQAEFAALVSLFSWDWMCVPKDHVDFRGTMAALGKNVRPLHIQIPDVYQEQLEKAEAKFKAEKENEKPRDGIAGKGAVSTVLEEKDSLAEGQAKQDPMAIWLKQKTDAGYTLKPHTLPTGRVTRSLLRGPFIPVAPARSMINCFSITGEDLTLIDSDTGIEDVSYKIAWHLGRALAMADRSLTAALLRFRGHVHAEAVRRVKARRTVASNTGSGANNAATGEFTMAACFESLKESVSQLQKAHNITGLADNGGQSRWLRTPQDRQGTVLSRLAIASAQLDLDGDIYAEELQAVVDAFFGFPPSQSKAEPEIPPISQRTIDPDAVLIRAWIVDKLYLAGVPLHNLLPDPDMLPRESIRTFCIDPKWLDSAIDGGLSIANHFAHGDDAVRRAIKSCLNRYIGEVRSHGPGKDTTLQMPKWGFLLRSVAVTAFPDLKVEAEFSENVPEGIREVLYMQVLADDILLCLFDRVPGEDNFDKIRISQPSHQQSFAAGSELTNSRLDCWFRPVPRVALSSVVGEERQTLEQMFAPMERHWEKNSGSDGEKIEPVYDWEARMIRPDAFSKQYVTAVAGPEKDETKVWKWTETVQDVPSAVLALQLSTANLQLTLHLEKRGMFGGGGDENGQSRWTKPGVQLDVKSQTRDLTRDGGREPASASAVRTAAQQPKMMELVDPKWVPLPTGVSASMKATAAAPDETLRQHNLTAHGLQDQNSNTIFLPHVNYSEKATWCPWPSKAACFSLFDPDTTHETSPNWNLGGSTIHALRTPMELVFALRQSPNQPDLEKKYPERLEVRIPVMLSQERSTASSDDEISPFLIIPGTAAAPVLPRVEGLNGSDLWSYNISLIVGSLFNTPKEDGNMPKMGDPLEARPNKNLLLVVTATPRFGKDRMKDAFFDGSFMLQQARVVQPAPLSEYKTQFDISWQDHAACPRQVTVRPANTLKMGEPTHLFVKDRQHLYLNMTVHSSSILGPDDEVVWEARLRNGSKQELARFPLAPSELRTSTASSKMSDINLYDLTEQSPESLQLHVRSKSTGRLLGPRTAPVFFPEIPPRFYPVNVRFTWDRLGIHASWKQPPNVPRISGVDKPYKVRFMLGSTHTAEEPDVVKTPSISSPIEASLDTNQAYLQRDVHIAASDLEGEQTLRIVHHLVVDTKRLVGVLEENADIFSLLLLDTSPKNARLPRLDFSKAPIVHPHSQITTWRNTSEIWFVATDNKITSVRCRRDLQRSDQEESMARYVEPLQIYNGPSEALSVGALTIFPLHSLSAVRHQLAWVNLDGGIDAAERLVQPPDGLAAKWYPLDVEFPRPHMTLGQPGLAYKNIGSLCVSGVEDAMCVVWAGPQAGVWMTDCELDKLGNGDNNWFNDAGNTWSDDPEDDTSEPGSDDSGRDVPEEPRRITPDSEVAVNVSQAICAARALNRRRRDFFWVQQGGGIRWMRFITDDWHNKFPYDMKSEGPVDLLSKDDEARIADNADANFSGCGPVALTTIFASRERLFLFWVDGIEGRVWGKTALLPGGGRSFNDTQWSPKFCVTRNDVWKGPLAHPTSSRLTCITRSLDTNVIHQGGANGPQCSTSFEESNRGYIIYLLWFDTEGRLRGARTLDNERMRFQEWTECMLPDDVASQVKVTPPTTTKSAERKMELIFLPSTDGGETSKNVHDLVWVDHEGRLNSLGVNTEVRWGY